MPTIFSRIISGEIPCHKIAENETYFAFLDIMPLAPGHVLVVPKMPVDYIFDVDDDILAGMLPFAKRIAHAMEKVIPCERIGVSVIGLEVPHAHVHLIPLNEMDEMRFQNKVSLTKEEFEDLAKAIQNNL